MRTQVYPDNYYDHILPETRAEQVVLEALLKGQGVFSTWHAQGWRDGHIERRVLRFNINRTEGEHGWLPNGRLAVWLEATTEEDAVFFVGDVARLPAYVYLILSEDGNGPNGGYEEYVEPYWVVPEQPDVTEEHNTHWDENERPSIGYFL